MAKAVLVMDMAECCADCPLRSSEKTSYVCCYLTLKNISSTDYYDKKPDRCPLRELPEKKERRIGEHGERMFRAGFNACLNEIMRQGMSDSVD